MTHVDSGFHGYVLTTAMCSCDLYSSTLNEETWEEHENKLRSKYKKRGWSDKKIQRAIVDANTAEKPNKKGLRADARELIARVADESTKVQVFVHMYRGNQMTEKVPINEHKKVSSSVFRTGRYTLECDTLVTVEGERR